MKELFRVGTPDSQKRKVLLKLFEIDPQKAKLDYQALKNQAGEEFIN